MVSVAAAALAVVSLDGRAPARAVSAEVAFDKTLQPWDGFGVNYVEAAQTRDYRERPQDYGGFSTLSEAQRSEILDLIFGADGLRPGVLKMFLDPFHEGSTTDDNDNADPNVLDASRFDHRTTTAWMRLFAREGLARTRDRGGNLSILTTLYGPPAWMTEQQIVRGRDLAPAMQAELAEYITAWTMFLRTEEQLPVDFVSLHNEGEDYNRWPLDGNGPGEPHHDYNLFWRSPMVVDLVKRLRTRLDKEGLRDVGVTPGETTFWAHFSFWGFAWDLSHDPEALAALGLVTSHGFGTGAAMTSTGLDLLRVSRPTLRAWATSLSWGRMDAAFLDAIRQNIYSAKVSAVIPWACVQTDDWYGGDPNAGTAVRVRDGDYSVLPGYHFYKQVTRAGQPGMAVAEVASSDPAVRLMAFASHGSRHADAVVLLNLSPTLQDVTLRVSGSAARTFDLVVTDATRRYHSAGTVPVVGNNLRVQLPPGSASTLFAR